MSSTAGDAGEIGRLFDVYRPWYRLQARTVARARAALALAALQGFLEVPFRGGQGPVLVVEVWLRWCDAGRQPAVIVWPHGRLRRLVELHLDTDGAALAEAALGGLLDLVEGAEVRARHPAAVLHHYAAAVVAAGEAGLFARSLRDFALENLEYLPSCEGGEEDVTPTEEPR